MEVAERIMPLKVINKDHLQVKWALFEKWISFHKQYFIKAIRQNPKTDYIKPSRKVKWIWWISPFPL